MINASSGVFRERCFVKDHPERITKTLKEHLGKIKLEWVNIPSGFKTD